MITVDLDFILSHPNGDPIIKDIDEQGNFIYREAWETFAENITDAIIKLRRDRGENELADSWTEARSQFLDNKYARITHNEYSYLKRFLTEDVIKWIGTLKDQFLSAFDSGKS